MRLKTAVALTCAAVLVVAGCGRKGSSSRTLAFITNNASDFWTIARKGTEKADAERADITVEFRLGDGTAAGQKRIVDDLLAKGVDGIAISPVDPANQTAMLDDAAQRTLVFTHDSAKQRLEKVSNTDVRCAPLQDLVADDADENDATHHGEIERVWNPEKIYEVLQHLEQCGPEEDADDRALASAQAATAEHGGGDAVQLEEAAVRGG